MARITINTKASFDIDEVFKSMRDIYTPEQLARMAVRMGTTKIDEYGFAELVAKEACKVIHRKYNDKSVLESSDPDYAFAVSYISTYEE